MATPSPVEQARINMIEQQIRPWKVLNQRVLDTFVQIPREAFVNEYYQSLAFSEARIPLENNDKMLFPALEGRILQEVKITPEESVLVIGTGSGFLSACCAHLGKTVTSVDLHAGYNEKAAYVTTNLAIENIHYKTLDVSKSLQGLATYDVVIISASLKHVPEEFFNLLNDQGRLFAFVGTNPATHGTVYHKLFDHIHNASIFEVEIERLSGFEDKPTFVF